MSNVCLWKLLIINDDLLISIKYKTLIDEKSPQIHEYDSRSKACIDVLEVDSFLNIEHSGSELHTECKFRYQYDTPGIGVTFCHIYAALRKALRCSVSLSQTRVTYLTKLWQSKTSSEACTVTRGPHVRFEFTHLHGYIAGSEKAE